MRRGWVWLVVLLTMTACSRQTDSTQVVERPRQVVQIQTAEEQIRYETLQYIGSVAAESVVPYSLTLGGTLEHVYVRVGDSVRAGDLLAAADDSDAQIGVQSAGETTAAVELDYEKAISARDYYQSLYEQTQQLYESGAVSKKDLDELALQLELSEKDVDQAKKMLNQARIDNAYKSSQADDFSIISGIDGTVVDVLHEEGEVVGSGYPVVVVSGQDQIVTIYLTENDLERLESANAPNVTITIGDERVTGIIDTISHIPESLTQTYRVDIALDSEKQYLLGSLCNVAIQIDAMTGIWVPIDDIQNDEGAFVYTVNSEDQIEIKAVTLHEISGEFVRIEGVTSGDKIVTSKAILIQGQKVQTSEATHD